MALPVGAAGWLNPLLRYCCIASAPGNHAKGLVRLIGNCLILLRRATCRKAPGVICRSSVQQATRRCLIALVGLIAWCWPIWISSNSGKPG
jgi:hypothetical protein